MEYNNIALRDTLKFSKGGLKMISAVPERLKEKRIKSNLTQKAVAEELKISQSTYAGYETGKRQPDIETLLKLANLFETSTDYLLGRYS
jgi:Predicted transcriptional regulators